MPLKGGKDHAGVSLNTKANGSVHSKLSSLRNTEKP